MWKAYRQTRISTHRILTKHHITHTSNFETMTRRLTGKFENQFMYRGKYHEITLTFKFEIYGIHKYKNLNTSYGLLHRAKQHNLEIFVVKFDLLNF